MKRIIFLLLVITQSLHGQIIPNPRFLHEELTLGGDFRSTLNKITSKRHGGELSRQQTDNPFVKKDAALFFLFYTDILFGKQCGVSLQFSKADSVLDTIQLNFLGVDPLTGKSSKQGSQSLDVVWDSLSRHFGTLQKESNIPFIAKKRVWLFPSTEVVMTRLSSGTSLIAVTYSRRK